MDAQYDEMTYLLDHSLIVCVKKETCTSDVTKHLIISTHSAITTIKLSLIITCAAAGMIFGILCTIYADFLL